MLVNKGKLVIENKKKINTFQFPVAEDLLAIGGDDADQQLVDTYQAFRDYFEKLKSGKLSFGPHKANQTSRFFSMINRFENMSHDEIDIAKMWENHLEKMAREKDAFVKHI